MARIPEEEIQRIKEEVPLEDLCRQYGMKFEPHGSSDLIACCPFHDDRTPSFVVTPSKNLWHCLGACQQGGSAIDFIMKIEGVSFRHAYLLLRDRASLGRDEPRPVKRSTVPKLEAPIERDAEDDDLMRQIVDYYHQTLKESPEALDYLQKRGLHSSELIDRFKIGFANRTLGYRLPDKGRKAGAEMRGRLEKIGLYRTTGHEHFNGSIVVPIFDKEGRVSEMYGRKITKGLRKGTPRHLYLPGPHYGVWNAEAFAASKEIILCEALIDAMTFWCAGFRNVTASYGTKGFMPDHLEAFKEHGTERVMIAYDRDEAGETAAWKVAQELNRHGIETYRIHFPQGMDANDYALKVTPASRSLGVLLRQSVWLGKSKATPSTPLVESSSCADADTSSLSSLAAIAANEENPDSPQEDDQPEVDSSSEPSETSDSHAVGLAKADASSVVQSSSDERETVFTFGDRRYRIRGLAKNTSYDTLRINLLASCEDRFHVDTLDLYSARQRAAFINQAAAELNMREEIIKRDLGRVLLKLEELQEQQITEAMKPKDNTVRLEDMEKQAALALLKDERLLDRILADFDRCGVVGEHTNKLLGYLAAVSRKLEAPLAVIIQSSSAAGKSSLMEAILALMPEEEQVKYSAMTGQSLFYMGETDLKHKILAIVEEEGAERASYALKLLQSEGELMIASTGKDPHTGRLTTEEYHVEGPVMIFLTTTAIDIDEELLNRCVVLTVDENREQTRAIHERQREAQTLEGLLARKDRNTILKLHRDAQRLLRPLLVANPFARELTFLDDRTRTRRDHMKYLTLIRTIALLHQYQRPVKTVTHNGQRVQYIEVSVSDIETANRLAHDVLGRSLDELTPQTRRLLLLLDEMVTAVCKEKAIDRAHARFTRKDVRRFTGWSYEQVRVHLDRLVEFEYVLPLRGGRGQNFVYELIYDGQGQDGRPFVMQLLDVDRLRDEGTTSIPTSKESGPQEETESGLTTSALGGETDPFGVSLGGHTGPIPGHAEPENTAEKPSPDSNILPLAAPREKALLGSKQKAVVVS